LLHHTANPERANLLVNLMNKMDLNKQNAFKLLNIYILQPIENYAGTDTMNVLQERGTEVLMLS